MSVREGSSTGFIERLESLRGLAALWVAVGHSMIWLVVGSEAAIWSKPVWKVHGVQATIARVLITFFSGAAAVDIFFVLSGFVLARSLAGAAMTPSTYAQFVVRRLFRIVPAFWFSLVVVVLYLTVVYGGHSVMPGASDWLNRWYANPLTVRTIAENATFISPWLNPNAWTLKVEILASLLLPLIVWCLGEKGAVRSAVVLIGSIELAWICRDAPSDVTHYLYMFVVGALLAKHGNTARRAVIDSEVFAACCVIVVVLASACFPLIHPIFADFMVVTGSAGLICALTQGRRPKAVSILGTRWARFLGRISYSFYLLHFIVLYATGTALLHLLPAEVVLRWPLAVMAAGCVISIAVSMPIAMFAFDRVEKPFTLMGRRLSNMQSGVVSR
ncbi:acyltransferase [Paraburkholderia graminis]|uniref:acyltransferase family protein n=1 Tax=Paraburkholderia graminis TaxID=60548 RepID=UPI0038BB1FF5